MHSGVLDVEVGRISDQLLDPGARERTAIDFDEDLGPGGAAVGRAENVGRRGQARLVAPHGG